MKHCIFVLLLFCSAQFFSQIDKDGNPIFNSKKLEVVKIENLEIRPAYYTIDDNISNRLSSVFVNENPSEEDYLKFATTLPSYYFEVYEKGELLEMLILIPNKGSYFYFVVVPKKKKQFQLPSNLHGEITEHRTLELLTYELFMKASVSLVDNKEWMLFHGKKTEVLQYKDILQEVQKIVIDKVANQEKPEDINVESFIAKESFGGKLDFTKQLEQYDGKLIAYENIMYNKKDFNILLWGAAVSKLGVNDFETIKSIWEKTFKRKLTEPEERALKKGTEFK